MQVLFATLIGIALFAAHHPLAHRLGGLTAVIAIPAVTIWALVKFRVVRIIVCTLFALGLISRALLFLIIILGS